MTADMQSHGKLAFRGLRSKSSLGFLAYQIECLCAGCHLAEGCIAKEAFLLASKWVFSMTCLLSQSQEVLNNTHVRHVQYRLEEQLHGSGTSLTKKCYDMFNFTENRRLRVTSHNKGMTFWGLLSSFPTPPTTWIFSPLQIPSYL